MRSYAYRISQIALDTLVSLLFVRPLLERLFPVDGKFQVLYAGLVLLIPTVTTVLQFILSKELPNAKRTYVAVTVTIVFLASNILYWLIQSKFEVTLAFIITIGIEVLAEIAIGALIVGKAGKEGTPKVKVQLLYSMILAMLTWLYLKETAMIGFVVVLTVIAIAIITVWLQYAGQKGILIDAVIGIIIIGCATGGWYLLNLHLIMEQSRGLRIGIILSIAVLIYCIVLDLSEKSRK